MSFPEVDEGYDFKQNLPGTFTSFFLPALQFLIGLQGMRAIISALILVSSLNSLTNQGPGLLKNPCSRFLGDL